MKNILTVTSLLILWYFGTGLVTSAVQLANAADRLHQGLGQYLFWSLISIFIILIATPLVLYFKLPKALIPPEDPRGVQNDTFLDELRKRLSQNKELNGLVLNSNNDIPVALEALSLKADTIIKNSANKVFLGTAVMQNGRLDGLIVLVTQMRMVWLIAKLYYQRPSPRQMIYLYSNVSTTVFLADSIADIEFFDLTAPLVASVLPSIKGAIPGLQGFASLLANSIANGSANAFLTLRVGIIAKQYCEALTKPSQVELRKSATVLAMKMVIQLTKENGTHFTKVCWDKLKWWKSAETV